MPRYYPMMMDLQGRTCVVVGGGEVAARKAEMLLKCGAVVRLVAPEVHELLLPFIEDGRIEHINADYDKSRLKGCSLVIASTDDSGVNRTVYRDAAEKGIPVNVVDVPELCSFIVPSVVEKGDLIVAISTSGKSPAMAKRIRKELQEYFGDEYAVMLELMGEVRTMLMKREPDIGKRMKLLSGVANSNLMEKIRQGQRPTAEEVLEEALSQ